MNNGRIVQITSTFTCTPIEKFLRHAVIEAGVADGVGFTPPAQLSEYMLLPSLDSERILGTIVMVRVEDWLREYVKSVPQPASDSHTRQELRAQLDEFLSQLAILSMRGRPVWFLACPSTGSISEPHKLASLCRTYTNLLSARVSNLSQVMVLNWPSSWPAGEFNDHGADRASHVPFRQAAFDKLGEFLGPQLARTLAKSQSSTAPAGSTGSPELAAFLAGLHVKVAVVPAEHSDRAHVDRILRTAASFSLAGENPTISESEIDAILESGNCMLVAVSDRLSDLGPSGVVVARSNGEALVVESMSLSCTVLGKQVEYAVLSALAQIAVDRELAKIVFEYRPSGRNQPTLAFLRATSDAETDQRYVLPLRDAEARINKAAIAPSAWSFTLLTAKSAG